MFVTKHLPRRQKIPRRHGVHGEPLRKQIISVELRDLCASVVILFILADEKSTMNPRIINGLAEFQTLVGQEIGVSDYLTITQEQINQFADATLDHQWIHVDPERAKTESPFGGTVAHGYLEIALLPYLWGQIADVKKVKMLVNYGIEDFKFNQPVKVNDQVRIRIFMDALTNLRGIIRTRMKVTMEIFGNPKPAFVGYIIFLYHFTD